MQRTMLKSKIHRATVTGLELDYEGSIAIDPVLLEAADILPGEQVQVLNLQNGERLITYAILGKRGTLAQRRIAIARLHARGPGSEISSNKAARTDWKKNDDVVRILFDEIAPSMKDRQGGYTRIYKLGRRASDSAEEAILEWVTYIPPQPPAPEEDKGTAAKGKKKTKKAEAAAEAPAEKK